MYGSGVAFLPRGIEKLTLLRTLTNFIVGRGGVQSGAANLGELGNLSDLRGTLWIEKLRNVRDMNEAMKAEIKKKHLTGLYLLFNGDETELQVDENALIEALQPPSNLQGNRKALPPLTLLQRQRSLSGSTFLKLAFAYDPFLIFFFAYLTALRYW
ncbi:hypothetical protein OIU74_017134 [Salix koriyanagi]|uniref:R13L1/DRL21-like LRR repeat region domain-containing protein n=1 Tax=Salix koriyanagi TaxID=2511006 RepID=A0A9Q0SSL9_9ROSI|nr:hypothetical protein OIU74_017134 [Salix koriyanagi]